MLRVITTYIRASSASVKMERNLNCLSSLMIMVSSLMMMELKYINYKGRSPWRLLFLSIAMARTCHSERRYPLGASSKREEAHGAYHL